MSGNQPPLHELFTSKRSPGWKPFYRPGGLVDGETFRRKTAGLATYLHRRTESRWVLVCEDTYAFSVGLFATWQADDITIHPPNTKPGTIEESYARADGILSDKEELTELGEVVDPLDHAEDPATLTRMDPERVCAELMTSGTTGERKILEKTINHFWHDINAYESLWGKVLDGAHSISSVSHQHIFGLLFHVLWPLSAGRTVRCVQAVYPGDVREQITEADGSYLVTSPAPLERLLRSEELKGVQPSLRAVFSGGGLIPENVARSLHEQVGLYPRSVFGTTETGGIAWRHRRPDRVDPGWTLLPGVEIRIDVSNELHVRSPKVSGSDEEWYPTGDAAERLDEGEFRLKGRIDRVVKVAENRVSLPELEEKLAEEQPVRDAAVFVYHDGSGGGRRTELGVVVELTPVGEEFLSARSEEELVDRLRSDLDPYFERVVLPDHWAFTDRLPQDRMSKLKREDLLKFFEGTDR